MGKGTIILALACALGADLSAQTPPAPAPSPALKLTPAVCATSAGLAIACNVISVNLPVAVSPATAPIVGAPPVANSPKPAKTANPIVLIGTSMNASTSPKPAGFAAAILPLNTSQQVYSWTMYQMVGVPGKVPMPQTTTGVATVLRSVSFKKMQLDLVGIGAIGAATTPTATTVAYNGGGGLLIHNLFPKWPSVLTWVGALQNKGGGSNTTQAMFSFGKAF